VHAWCPTTFGPAGISPELFGKRQNPELFRAADRDRVAMNLGEPLLPGQQEALSRDLEAARVAYASGDASASRAAHATTPIVVASEGHQEGGGRVKAIVFGGCVAAPLPWAARGTLAAPARPRFSAATGQLSLPTVPHASPRPPAGSTAS